MKTQNKSMVLVGIAFGLLLALSVQAAPIVSNVVGAQRARTKLVDITYDLADADHATLSVTIKISKDGGVTWDVPCLSLSGNGIGPQVTPGKGKLIVWDAGADWNGQWSDRMKVEVTATIGGGDAPPIREVYLVVDLTPGPEAPRYQVSSLYSAPVNGWPDEFKSTKLVLRKIPAGTFTMGSPENELGRSSNETQHQVTLTKDFYVGVFEVTQKQWERVMGDWPSYFYNVDYRDTRPVERVSYDDIRGNDAGSGWPANNAVDADSFLGRLREKTGLIFDLPTEAQWEYACRAGTTTALNSGKNLTDESECQHVAEVGRYEYNRGQNQSPDVDTSGATAKVGSYLPNSWRLYDMHGNVWEWCLDGYDKGDYPPQAETDPKGVDEAPYRILRDGGWNSEAYYCRSARRDGNISSYQYAAFGFRLALTVQ
ncbi:MAG: Serine/threonine-protein kinase pkn1 [Lentisphaerae bacterium ADurb.Bin082]|nr:MAG: Serine/threonine-protein kinase pkn1 [Lentisphaerae bacterium ADurb.Bin082]